MGNSTVLQYAAVPAAGFIAGQACVLVLNAVPAGWLCDYGEEPGAELSGRRFYHKKQGLISGYVLAVVFTLLYVNYRADPFTAAVYCLASAVLTAASISDIKYKIIPDQFSLFTAFLGAAYYIYAAVAHTNPGRLYCPFIGAACGGGLWLLLALIGKAAYREDCIGFGDVKLSAAAGFILSFPLVLASFFITIISAGAVFSVLLLLKKTDGKSYMPMAPFICAGFAASLILSDSISALAAWYISILTA